jgi:hypothetical protein
MSRSVTCASAGAVVLKFWPFASLPMMTWLPLAVAEVVTD